MSLRLGALVLKKGYSQEQIASEVGVSLITVNNWLTGHSLMAQREVVVICFSESSVNRTMRPWPLLTKSN
jgi:transcriptional regulator with XRE-family HTH domain